MDDHPQRAQIEALMRENAGYVRLRTSIEKCPGNFSLRTHRERHLRLPPLDAPRTLRVVRGAVSLTGLADNARAELNSKLKELTGKELYSLVVEEMKLRRAVAEAAGKRKAPAEGDASGELEAEVEEAIANANVG